jgi:hypothetical protein
MTQRTRSPEHPHIGRGLRPRPDLAPVPGFGQPGAGRPPPRPSDRADIAGAGLDRTRPPVEDSVSVPRRGTPLGGPALRPPMGTPRAVLAAVDRAGTLPAAVDPAGTGPIGAPAELVQRVQRRLAAAGTFAVDRENLRGAVAEALAEEGSGFPPPASRRPCERSATN